MTVRSYEAADKGRLSDGWQRIGGAKTSADSEIALAGATLRDRSRHLVRNNPHAAKAVSVLVNNIVGSGIIPRANTGKDATDKLINELFEQWSYQCDASGQLDFYGIQTLAVREMLEGGEILVRRRPRRLSDGLIVPLQLQLLEADFLDESKNGEARGGYIVQGIEFDPIDRRRGYWLFNRHPGSSVFTSSIESKFVPAEELAHMYEQQRTQARGVPWLTPVIQSLANLDDYELAEMVRKKMEACLVAMVTSDDSDNPGITDVAAQVVDKNGNLIERMAPGMIAYLKGGKDIKFNQPSGAGGYGEYKKAELQTIASGARVPYELLTNDLSQVNFSSARVGLVEFRRMCEAVQWQIVIPSLCMPVWRWFSQAAFAMGASGDAIMVEWAPPKFESVTPLEDAQADLMRIRMGTMTLPQAIEKEGYNSNKQFDEIATTNALLDQLKISLDSDPRNLTKNGQLQQSLAQDQQAIDNADGGSDNASTDEAS